MDDMEVNMKCETQLPPAMQALTEMGTAIEMNAEALHSLRDKLGPIMKDSSPAVSEATPVCYNGESNLVQDIERYAWSINEHTDLIRELVRRLEI